MHMSIILMDNNYNHYTHRLSSSSPRIKLSLYMAFSCFLLIDSVHIIYLFILLINITSNTLIDSQKIILTFVF